ncbi:spondin-2 [Aedes aegypti]|uniref:Spondin domain-containing protein n=1 Tax=Aedes aegypti TaxID=7159 RepID=A0A6I8U3X1_AEDAE|nr:spondin-2 [Aedes aegypti]XP_021707924.1 spondin-2 [Aedes aegypti]XP_021707925.1 spondin-2 [Aedes aegypti]XP_021707926.1 spondin-2 [Aedes aegypti]XP_021707927.1 spondin-2 [Aedes aegypti]
MMKMKLVVLWRQQKPAFLVPLLLGLVVLLMDSTPITDGAVFQSESCSDSEALVFYRIKLATNWSKKLFPKHYPEFRPPPQWSITYGQSHNNSYHLFRMKDYASPAIQAFAESAHSRTLQEELARQNSIIYDEFHMAKIPKGAGSTQGTFFVDGRHHKVSFITKIIPSPDWFIGLDSYDLCSDGQWVDDITLDLHPVDAGTSNGLTFTSPKWPTNPPGVIEKITARYPNHFASSFFYPEIKHLPAIAKVTFTKLHEYHGTNNVQKKMKKLKNKQRKRLLKKLALVNRKQENETIKQINDCEVSKWSEWSACSQSCGLGKRTRTRVVVKHSKDQGQDCPRLMETQWCGSARECTDGDSYFRW